VLWSHSRTLAQPGVLPLMTRPTHFYFTGDDEADGFLAEEPLALLVGFVLDRPLLSERLRLARE
jgi:hypothetical protein